jgi:hypothetical protein
MSNEPVRVDYSNPDEQAEVVEVQDEGAWLRFRSRETGKISSRNLGEENPMPIEDVRKWAAVWNKHGRAEWPDAWILVEPTKPISAAAMYKSAKGYGPTLTVMIRVSRETWREYSTSKDKLLDELAKLPAEAPAVIPLDGGLRYQCFGSTLGTFSASGEGLYEMVASAPCASIVLYGETIDPA